MSELTTAIVVFACTFGGALLGLRLATRLPAHHLTGESRETVKVAVGLIATMTALVLGLVTASAKSSFDGDDASLQSAAVDVLMLDRALARYGPETADARATIRRVVAARLEIVWPEAGPRGTAMDGPAMAMELEDVEARIGALAPDSDARRRLQARALDLANGLSRTRWEVLEHAGDLDGAIPRAFLVILTCWLGVIFVSFGLLAPRNATTVAALFLCAISVAAAVYVILELATPFDGLIKVSPGPLRYALAYLGK